MTHLLSLFIGFISGFIVGMVVVIDHYERHYK